MTSKLHIMAKKVTTFQKELREKSAQVQKQIKLRHIAERKAKVEERKLKHKARVEEKKTHAAERKAKQATERAERAEKRELLKQGRLTRAVGSRTRSARKKWEPEVFGHWKGHKLYTHQVNDSAVKPTRPTKRDPTAWNIAVKDEYENRFAKFITEGGPKPTLGKVSHALGTGKSKRKKK